MNVVTVRRGATARDSGGFSHSYRKDASTDST